MNDYRTFDDAIRDGWYVGISAGPPWWSHGPSANLKYHLTAKKGEWHVELAGNSLSALRNAVRMLRSVPRDDIPFGREWWRSQAR